MARWLIKKTHPIVDRAAFGVGSAINHALDAGMTDRPGAHRAWLQRDIKPQARQAIARLGRAARAQGQDFCMRTGIMRGNGRVASLPYHALRDGIPQQGPDGHFPRLPGPRGRRKRLSHQDFIMPGVQRIIAIMHASKSNPAAVSEDPEDGERIAKVLARAGLCSRRDAERLIAEGRVSVNALILTTPAVKVGPTDAVRVDGQLIAGAEPARMWRYHKPAGLVTTHKDPKGRPTVFEHLPEGLPRVISVGRLDLNSEGLLLLTNDGALARRLELPANGWVRHYRARAHGNVTQAALDGLAEGLTISGVRYGPITARLDRQVRSNAWIDVSITEGKNREVRRVLEHIGLTVNRLIRTAYGPFQLGLLKPGTSEEISRKSLRAFFEGA